MGKMRRSSLASVMCVLALALLCTGSLWASGTGDGGSEAGKKITLRGTKWQSFVEEKTMMEDWSARYTKAHPNVTIQFEMITTGYGEKLTAGFAGGTAPDYYYVNFKDLPAQVVQGMPRPLDAYIDGKNGVKRADIFDEIWKAGSYKGKTYSYSRNNGVQILYYNKKMFQAAGVPFPNENWTWDDLAAAAKKLIKKDASGRIEQYGFQCDEYARVWVTHLWSNNGKDFDDSYAPKKALFNGPEGVAAAKYLMDLVQSYGVAPPPGVPGALGYREAFSTQKVAMILDGSWMVKSFAKVQGLDYGTMLVPKGKIRTGWYDVNGFCSASTNKFPDTTWDVIKFMTSLDISLEYADYGGNNLGGMPSWKTAYTDPRWKPTAVSAPIAEQMKFARAEYSWYNSGKWFWNMLNTSLQAMVTKKLDPQKVLDDLAAETQKEILDKTPQ
jgi:multiple sugar transport system substrate-binding protein